MRLLIGGSPCTHWSIAQTKNRETEPSGIGWELFENYLIALGKFKPNYFLYENNKSMSAAIREEITKRLGVEPICINSALVSAQNRQRLYWTNIPGVQHPENKGILLRDILEEIPESFETVRYEIIDGQTLMSTKDRMRQANKRGSRQGTYVYFPNAEKSNTLLAAHAKDEMVILPISPFVLQNYGCEITSTYLVSDGEISISGEKFKVNLLDGYWYIRHLTLTECKRLQTVPDSYVFPVSDTQAYKMLGNGWTVDVIAHILSHCPGITTERLDVLSMYDGMACGHIALNKLGVRIERYRATEIDKYAIKTACHNFPDIEQLGDAFQVRDW
jgi:DNA (cytosine-5)-methyltransferase 3A